MAALSFDPAPLVATAIGVAIIAASGPLARWTARLDARRARDPGTPVASLLNKDRQDAEREWLLRGDHARANRVVMVLAGAAIAVYSLLLCFGVVD